MRAHSFLLATALCLGCVVAPTASASTFLPVPLSQLTDQSDVVVVATPIASKCLHAQIGKHKQLVTDVTVEVHLTLRGPDATGSDLVVRTLGGTADGVGRIVHGEARLVVGQTSLMFLKRGRDGELHVFGMAQGHYPVAVDEVGEWRVQPSAGFEGVMHVERSASALLAGRRLTDVLQLLRTGQVEP